MYWFNFNLFHATGLFLHPLKTSESLWLRGCRKRSLSWNGWSKSLKQVIRGALKKLHDPILRIALIYLAFFLSNIVSWSPDFLTLTNLAQCSISNPLKTSENQRFSDVLGGKGKENSVKVGSSIFFEALHTLLEIFNFAPNKMVNFHSHQHKAKLEVVFLHEVQIMPSANHE